MFAAKGNFGSSSRNERLTRFKIKLLLPCLSGLMEILPDRCTMIAKKELIYAGTVGLICWLGGIVFINRKKTSDAKSVMADAAKTMLDDQVKWGLSHRCYSGFNHCGGQQ